MEMIKKGRNMLIGLIVIVLLLDIVTTVSASLINATNGTQNVFRLILTGLMFFFLYKGRSWAKWLSVVLFMLSGIIGLLSLLAYFNLLLLVVSIVCLSFGIILISSNSVNNFLLYQAGEYTPDEE